jgi:hypothetical protein
MIFKCFPFPLQSTYTVRYFSSHLNSTYIRIWVTHFLPLPPTLKFIQSISFTHRAHRTGPCSNIKQVTHHFPNWNEWCHKPASYSTDTSSVCNKQLPSPACVLSYSFNFPHNRHSTPVASAAALCASSSGTMSTHWLHCP